MKTQIHGGLGFFVIYAYLCLCNGASSMATITLSPIYPDADTFVFSSVPTWNYGTGTNLVVNKAFDGSGHLSGERQTYIKFGLSSLAGYSSADVVSVQLKLYVNTTAGGSVVAYHSGDGWTETGVTWNSKPSLVGEPYMGTSPNLSPNSRYYSTDLLAGGTGWLAGDMSDAYLSVALLLPSDITESTTYYFDSKETNPGYPYYPYLEIQVVPEPATMLLLAVGAIALRMYRR
jgi:hypothetical protein